MNKQYRLTSDILQWKWDDTEHWSTCECPCKTRLAGARPTQCSADCVAFGLKARMATPNEKYATVMTCSLMMQAVDLED